MKLLTKSLLLSSATLLSGLLIIFIVSQQKIVSAKTEYQHYHQQRADAHARDIITNINHNFLQIRSIANFFSSSEFVSHQEFKKFIELVFTEFPEGRRITWLSHIEQTTQDQWLKKLSKNTESLYQSFTIFDYNAGNVYPPEVIDGYLTPVTYSYPAVKIPNFIGRNIGTKAPIAKYILPSIYNKKSSISDLNPPLAPQTKDAIFLYIYPVFESHGSHKEKIAGVIVSAQYVADIFKFNMIDNENNLFDYTIKDKSGNQYHYPSKTFEPVNSENKKSTIEENKHYQYPINISNSQWQLIITPKNIFNSTAAGILSLFTILGAILSLFFAFVVYYMSSKKIILEQKIQQETNKLNQAITQLNKQQDQLKQQNYELVESASLANKATKAKSIFIANMSHEIRTPMNGIVGMVELCTRTQLTEEQSDYLNKINISTQHLSGIIHDILDFSKIESNKLIIESQHFSLRTIIDKLQSIYNSTLLNDGITFEVSYDENVPFDLIGDETRICQVITNLCSNAVKFTDKGAIKIHISAQALNDNPNDLEQPYQLVFTVSDTGIGISEDQIESLFQAFTQADTSTTRKYGGSGLGLSISQRLCQLMGGGITVYSTEEEGSTFTATLNVMINYHTLIQDSQPTPLNDKQQLLIIDNNPAAQKLYQQILTPLNVKVYFAKNVDDVITLITQKSINAVIIDWAELAQNTIELFERMGALVKKKIIISTYSNKTLHKKLTHFGPIDVLQKPLSLQVLIDTLNKVDDGSSIIDEKESPPLTGLFILIAEDNRINQQIIKSNLMHAGAEITLVENGKQCVDILSQPHHFDLVLMDIQMPIMDGVNATKHIRAMKHNSHLPIIALTANVLTEDIQHYLNVGMNAYLSKPVENDIILSTIKKTLISPLPSKVRDFSGN
jgi:signal transduction histidine kinase/DNA-binding response OmpR family regulator